jgi:cytochrome bd-type quinol oxidase subunit 2
VSRHTINRICAIVPIVLSILDCVWVLGNVAGGVRGSGEGIGFKVFWLLIAIQIPFILGYLVTAEWRRWRGPVGIALQVAALVLAFAPVAYFKL